MAKTTRTLNPLHFEDLEPHRFEDLVRQLAYDLRVWRMIEAIGRAGSDQGIDIRAIEVQTAPAETADSGDPNSEGAQAPREAVQERLWIIQCKREKKIGPANARKILKDFFTSADPRPHVYVLAAACDFSKATRDAATDVARQHGVEEIFFWGKGELEDLLFQPKNDNLLFAYFGISLQVRQRSMRTELRSNLTLKRKLIKDLGSLQYPHPKPVLIRDPQDDDYPYIKSLKAFVKNPPWRYFDFHGHEPPDHLAFVTQKFCASVDWATGEWDFTKEWNFAFPYHPVLSGLKHDSWDLDEKQQICHAFCQLHVPAERRAWAFEASIIPYERILLCDELGDKYNEPPHLLVSRLPGGSLFSGSLIWLQGAENFHDRKLYEPDPGRRVSVFPAPIPDERETYYSMRNGSG